MQQKRLQHVMSRGAMSSYSCSECGSAFASRNALFKHLRSPSTPCGAELAASLPQTERVVRADRRDIAHASMSAEQKAEQKAKVQEKCARQRARAEERKRYEIPLPETEEDLAREIWLGGLTGRAATLKGLRDVLWRSADGDLSSAPLPNVRRLQRRGYRQDGAWTAYAFLVCHCAEEAAAWRAALHGREVCLDCGHRVILKAQPAVYKRTPRRPLTEASAERRQPGLQPSERQIFLAWPTPALEKRAEAACTTVAELAGQISEQISAGASDGPSAAAAPKYIEAAGVAVPAELFGRVREALLSARWPPMAQRQGVTTDEYLVLRRDMRASAVRDFTELRDACEALMEWADPSFEWDHLALTKNFVSSPHVDKEDKSFQYALSFGDFDGGGELCVEAADGSRRWMIDTRQRLAKFDGRSVHWVRGYSGERHSVVWYVNRPEHGTPQAFDVDLAWTPAGSAEPKQARK